MPRPSNTDARRAQITAALLAVMARQGYEKATIQAIAAEAGLAPGLVHYHFGSKQEILVQLVHTLAGAARARAQAFAALATTPLERLDAFLQARLGLGDGASSDAVAAWVMVATEAVRQDEVRAIYRAVVAEEFARLETLLADALRQRGRDPDCAGSIAAGLMALISGAFQMSTAAPGLMPAGYAAAAAHHLAVSSIEAAPGVVAVGGVVP